jgi:hypothetical protein
LLTDEGAMINYEFLAGACKHVGNCRHLNPEIFSNILYSYSSLFLGKGVNRLQIIFSGGKVIRGAVANIFAPYGNFFARENKLNLLILIIRRRNRLSRIYLRIYLRELFLMILVYAKMAG